MLGTQGKQDISKELADKLNVVSRTEFDYNLQISPLTINDYC